MRISKLLPRTYRENPSEIAHNGLQWLVRAGYFRALGANAYALLPLGMRSLQKIQVLLMKAFEQISAQAVHLPNALPNELWKETQRLQCFSKPSAGLNDNSARFNIMSPLIEEVVHWLVRREAPSYKQLPLSLYWLSSTWYDESSDDQISSFGHENQIFHLFSFADSMSKLEELNRKSHLLLSEFFQLCGLPIKSASSSTLDLPQAKTLDFYYPNSAFGRTYCYCPTCSYQAAQTIAVFRKDQPEKSELLELEKVATPNASTIQALADFLNIPKRKTAKAVFFMAQIPPQIHETLIFAVLRGDLEISEDKLKAAVGAYTLRPATEEEIIAINAQPGYASPIGIQKSSDMPCIIVVDEIIPYTPNLVAGANEFGYHYLNVNYGRDYQADLIADIALAQHGYPCPHCKGNLQVEYGIPIARSITLGDQLSIPLGVFFQDDQGQKQPLYASHIRLNLYSLLGCLVEQHHDAYGICFPKPVAPYQIYLIVLPDKNTTQAQETAERLYTDFCSRGYEVLFDDRDERPGVKFNDADLLGIPLRLTVSQRALSESGVEWKQRNHSEKKLIPLENIFQALEAYFK